ncbi:polyamine-modulated factor 1-binding protein 1-like [Neopsephotus bourkii]|uniref:polyamine-modulated factor 1-binding protein 1-like n=1 Tax=Neopsephotus bourkii TaxID=309878 RepID=UPI002AA5C58F|nr:polyamine-modulated factor 1-binding protein 1-like [Neopsephotus bourkii]
MEVVMGKEQKDEAVQTEVTFDVAAHGHADTSYNILEKHTLVLEQGEAVPATLSQAARLGTASLDSLQRTGEQPCLGKDPQQDEGCEVVAVLRALREEAASSRAEQAQSRELAEQLKAELNQWQWKHQVALEQALQHMHAVAHAAEELQRSQKQLQTLREQLGTQEEQSQGLQHHLAQLQEELRATQALEQQNLQQLSEAKETMQVLHQEVASSRKHMAELLEQVREITTLQAQLAQAQQEKAKQEEIAAYVKQKQQLHWELRKLQGSQEQCKKEAHSLQETLRELRSRAQYWQELYKNSAQALDMREEELVICKVELAFLKEELSKAMEQVKTLRFARALACSNGGRLHKETELLLVNISQCVKEPTHSNEKLGNKIQWEIKQTAELPGGKKHVQDTLQEEDTYLVVGTDEQQHQCEQLKGNNFTLPAPHNSAGLSPPPSCPRDRKQRKTKQGLDNF